MLMVYISELDDFGDVEGTWWEVSWWTYKEFPPPEDYDLIDDCEEHTRYYQHRSSAVRSARSHARREDNPHQMAQIRKCQPSYMCSQTYELKYIGEPEEIE